MIDPFLVPLTEWLFPEPSQERAERMQEGDPRLLSPAWGPPGPPEAAAPAVIPPARIRPCG